MDFIATWYSPKGGQGSGLRMRSGLPVSTKFMAVDTKIIPLGSIIEMEFSDGHKEYRIAADTGGAIKGRIVDIFTWSEQDASKNGRQKIKLRILGSLDLKEISP